MVTVDGSESKAVADQITTVAKERLLKFLSELSPHDMHKVEMAIRIQLDLLPDAGNGSIGPVSKGINSWCPRACAAQEVTQPAAPLQWQSGRTS